MASKMDPKKKKGAMKRKVQEESPTASSDESEFEYEGDEEYSDEDDDEMESDDDGQNESDSDASTVDINEMGDNVCYL